MNIIMGIIAIAIITGISGLFYQSAYAGKR